MSQTHYVRVFHVLSKTKTTSVPDGILMQGDCSAIRKNINMERTETHAQVFKSIFPCHLFFFFLSLKREKTLLPTAVEPGYWPEYFFPASKWTVHRLHTTLVALELLLDLSCTMNPGPRTQNMPCLCWINWYVLKIHVKGHVYVINLIKSP